MRAVREEKWSREGDALDRGRYRIKPIEDALVPVHGWAIYHRDRGEPHYRLVEQVPGEFWHAMERVDALEAEREAA